MPQRISAFDFLRRDGEVTAGRKSELFPYSIRYWQIWRIVDSLTEDGLAALPGRNAGRDAIFHERGPEPIGILTGIRQSFLYPGQNRQQQSRASYSLICPSDSSRRQVCRHRCTPHEAWSSGRLSRDRYGGEHSPFEQAGCRAVRLERRGVDHHSLWRSGFSCQFGKDAGEHAHPAPAHKAVVQRLGRAVAARRQKVRSSGQTEGRCGDTPQELRGTTPVLQFAFLFI